MAPAKKKNRVPAGMEKTTINVPTEIKRAAQKLAIDRHCTFQELVAEGLRLVVKGAKG